MDIVKTFLDIALLGSAWVLWLLLILSILSVALIIERLIFYLRIKIDFGNFHTKLSSLLVDDKVGEAETLCKEHPGIESKVALVGFDQSGKGVEALEESMSSYLISEKQNLDRGLVVLGTLGNNAPFIGLFGTVIGIIDAFNSLGANPAGGASVVMAGISEALVATAVGLLVAIPAVVAFNAFQRVVKRHMANAEAVMKLLLAYYMRRT